MKILFACLLLVLLVATGFSKSKGNKKSEKTTPNPKPADKETQKCYEKFRRQHIDNKMTAVKCDSEIGKKKIYNNDNSCKETNTFILDDPAKVKSICNGDGEYDEKTNMTKSRQAFKIVVCELNNQGARKPKCQYKGKELTNRFVSVRCQQGLPVHFDDDILDSKALC
ncbi:LOW QUALITY PROTEIN: ribonuclease-like 3 [Melanotaenia boesemani]|uniref:LOW QUALITY PROTEIN: ribonuclease-like 3 n=1 Tax=Melanotaenia boesemani TaxID=1250792 RepID=UPI001C03FF2E|nr:LOW QUALITY PROTEIN: ribonuclease-like 3 [Melanotaenia boesemani]